MRSRFFWVPNILSIPSTDIVVRQNTSDPYGLGEFIQKLAVTNFEYGPWVAGGAALKLATGRPIGTSDIDIFFANREQFIHCLKDLKTRFNVHSSDNNPAFSQVTIGPYRIQLICSRYYANINALFADFDFTVCRFATNGRTVYGTVRAWEDDRRKILSVDGPTRKSIFRLAKYCRAGYVPEIGILSRLVDAIPEDKVHGFTVSLQQDAY